MRFRVMTYNIHRAIGVDRRFRPERVLRIIESHDPDAAYFGDKLVNDACYYDSNGDSSRDRNWAVDWQNAHPGEWYACESAHSQPLNANLKAYAAWHLWARLAGWDGN